MYKVVEFFTDLQDNDHPYNVGDVFPRIGMDVSKERIAELSGTSNRRGIVLIEEVIEKSEEVTEKVEKPKTSAKPKKATKKDKE